MTFSDMICECEMYPYSKEYFEIMKECFELKLTAKAINNQLFLRENVNNLRSREVVFTEGYFMESSSDETLEIIMEDFNSKVEKLESFFKKKFEKICSGFIALLKKLGIKFDNLRPQAKMVYKKLSQHKFSISDIQQLETIINTELEKYKHSFRIRHNQPGWESIPINTEDNSDSNKIAEIKNHLSPCISSKKVILDPSPSGDVNTIGALSAESIYAALKCLKNGKKVNAINCKNAKSLLEESWKKACKDGIEMKVSSESLASIANELSKLNQTLFQKTGGSSNINDSVSNKAKDSNEKADDMDELRKVFAPINVCLSKTMTLYSGFLNYRYNVINKLNSFLDKSSSNTQSQTNDNDTNDDFDDDEFDDDFDDE